MKILLVDNSQDARCLVKEILKNESLDFIECDNGFSAVELYDKHLPDYVIMDISMEKMNGLEASKKILEKHPGAGIIIITQLDEKSLKEKAKQIGISKYILKDNLLELSNLLQESIKINGITL